MNPRGKTPGPQAQLDDALFELQCSADCQVVNTKHLLEYMDEADDDGVISSDEWAYITRHVRLEHRWNNESNTGLRSLRDLANGFFALFRSLRGQMQGIKKAALASGPNVHTAR